MLTLVIVYTTCMSCLSTIGSTKATPFQLLFHRTECQEPELSTSGEVLPHSQERASSDYRERHPITPHVSTYIPTRIVSQGSECEGMYVYDVG